MPRGEAGTGLTRIDNADQKAGDYADYHSDCGADHHVFKESVTGDVREQPGAPTNKRSKHQPNESEADERAG